MKHPTLPKKLKSITPGLVLQNLASLSFIAMIPCIALSQITPSESESIPMTPTIQTEISMATTILPPTSSLETVTSPPKIDSSKILDSGKGTKKGHQGSVEPLINAPLGLKPTATLTVQPSQIAKTAEITANPTAAATAASTAPTHLTVASSTTPTVASPASQSIVTKPVASPATDFQSQHMISMGIAAAGVILGVGGSALVTLRRGRKTKPKDGPQTPFAPAPTNETDARAMDQSDNTAVKVNASATKAVVTKDPVCGLVQDTPTVDPQYADEKGATDEAQCYGASAQAYIEPKDWMNALYKSNIGKVQAIAEANHALTCMTGQRHENQDYVCSFELAGNAKKHEPYQVMIVADGCGGHVGGRQASCMAVRFAGESVIKHADHLSANALIKRAMEDASAAVQAIGTKHWRENELRTTLIMVIATPTTYHLAWIGDGGISLHRANGSWQELMSPHKGAYLNVLDASLGPKQDGDFEYLEVIRQPGDHLYMGSDGIFDAVDHNFWTWFENNLVETNASPQVPMDQLLVLAAKDPHFDDNLSIAFLRTPDQPDSKTLPLIREVTTLSTSDRVLSLT